MQALDPVAADYLTALTERAQLLLLSDLVGVYAAGSIALDAYEPGRSDIDVAIVCSAELPVATKQAIVAALRHESLPCPARGLELVVYRTEVAGGATGDPGFEVELNTGPRMDFRATYAGADRKERDGTFWYAVDRSILAERGLALLGPPAQQVFRSVPDDELVRLLIASLRWHVGAESGAIGDAEEQEYASWTDDAVLNSCRALQRMRTGHWFSKVEAGRQVLANRSPEATGPLAGEEVLDPGVIRQALDARGGAAPPSVRLARQFQREVLAALEKIDRR